MDSLGVVGAVALEGRGNLLRRVRRPLPDLNKISSIGFRVDAANPSLPVLQNSRRNTISYALWVTKTFCYKA